MFFGFLVVLFVALGAGWRPAAAQDDDPTPTPSRTAVPTDPEAQVAALQEEVADLMKKLQRKTEEASTLRKQRNEARREVEALEQEIDELQARIDELEGQLPPTPAPTPQLTGKDAYPYVSNPLEIYTRPFNYIGEKMSFCGTVTYIEVARPGYGFQTGDTVSTSWSTIAQVLLDGVDARYVVGFDGDTSGIFEGSYVCAWGTLVDTATGTNAFGGEITNPLFDAEYFELV